MLLPATPGFTLSGFEPVTPEYIDPKLAPYAAEEVRHGTPDGPPDMRMLGGYFVFDSPDAALLGSLLPTVVHVRGAERLSTLVRLVGDEAIERRSGRDLVLTRLVEVLLIEALRATPGQDAHPGLLRGLADARIAPAIRDMHADVARSWTVPQLARVAALSRSAFFDRFTRTVGLPPMEYLLTWRMALAKDLLRRRDLALTEVAERVGYGSASAFSTAFTRSVGQPPSRYASAAPSRRPPSRAGAPSRRARRAGTRRCRSPRRRRARQLRSPRSQKRPNASASSAAPTPSPTPRAAREEHVDPAAAVRVARGDRPGGDLVPGADDAPQRRVEALALQVALRPRLEVARRVVPMIGERLLMGGVEPRARRARGSNASTRRPSGHSGAGGGASSSMRISRKTRTAS